MLPMTVRTGGGVLRVWHRASASPADPAKTRVRRAAISSRSFSVSESIMMMPFGGMFSCILMACTTAFPSRISGM